MVLSKLNNTCSSSGLGACSARLINKSHTTVVPSSFKFTPHSPNSSYAAALAAAGVLGTSGAVFYQYCKGEHENALLTNDQQHTVSQLKKVLSAKYVITNPNQQTAYSTGQRLGKGSALAVVRPGTLEEAVQCLRIAVEGNCAVVVQGANSGLTGGSVPRSNIDRPVVLISMKRLDKISIVGKGDSAKSVCLAGSGIFTLQDECGKQGRESHSVLGSVFLNPSTAAGVAFGSGGTQCRKGPAYTERVLYARVGSDGKVQIVDNTGIKASSLSDLYRKLESGDVKESDIDHSIPQRFWSNEYGKELVNLNSGISRYNADINTTCEAARSEGKVMILATVHQTFPQAKSKKVRWITTDDYDACTSFRTNVVLGDSSGKTLPASCEYMNKGSAIGTLKSGAFMCAACRIFGLKRLAPLYAIQKVFDTFTHPYVSNFGLLALGLFVPKSYILPKNVIRDVKKKEHHILTDFSEYGHGELAALEKRFEAWKKAQGNKVDVYDLTGNDIVKANMFRFTIAAAFKLMCITKGYNGLSLDYAVPKNQSGDMYGPQVEGAIDRWVYGHYACNVVHDDIAYPKAVCPKTAKLGIKKTIQSMGGVLPAEHGHGTEYAAPEATQKRLRKIDPLNVFNPGIAGTSAVKSYAD